MLKIQFRARKYTMYVRRGELEHVHVCIHFCFYSFMKNQIQEKPKCDIHKYLHIHIMYYLFWYQCKTEAFKSM